MRCPVCGVDNPDASVRCASCRGVLSHAGVDYSRLSDHVDWQDCGSLSDERERAKAGAFEYSLSLFRLLLLLAFLGLSSSYMLFTGHAEGDANMQLAGLGFLALFTLLLWILWRQVKAAYSEPDLPAEPMSVQDMDKVMFDKTGLPPRR